jgi:hypothetical protein
LHRSGVLLIAIRRHRPDGDGQCAWSTRKVRPEKNIALKGSATMKHVLASLAIGACLLLPSAGVVLGAGKTAQTPTTGQPGAGAGVGCGTGNAIMTPGNAALSPGSPFNEPGSLSPTDLGGTGGQNYAGSGAGSAHANSTAAVSQYDIACANVTAHQPP